MLTVRYNAMFTETSHPRAYAELAWSLAGLELYLAPYAQLHVEVFTSREARPSLARLLEATRLAHRLTAVDEEDAAAYAFAQSFAQEIRTASPVDRICIARMLTDFRLLPADRHRLLLGADVFFVGVPDELLAYAWEERPRAGVAYAVDVTSFKGKRYGLRYWHGPLLRGLLGDLYCLAPGVTLSGDVIRSCLRLVDSWPRARRFDPAIDDELTVCEQQAAAILLAPFGGLELPPERYTHYRWHDGAVALHTHDLGAVEKRASPAHRARAAELLERARRQPVPDPARRAEG